MDCNACEFCLDKKKNGGPGLKRKACLYKQRGGGPAAGGSQSADGAGAQQPAEAAISLAHSIRREEARFAWGGYGSAVSEAQAGQAELDDVRPIKSTPFLGRRHPVLLEKPSFAKTGSGHK